MTGRLKPKQDCYCAFCKTKRHVYKKKHSSVFNFMSVLLFSFCLSTGLWTWWDPRSIAIFSIAMLFSEVFIYLRWRFSVVCSACGFDPVLYRKSPELARDRVRQFYEKKTQEPNFLLSQSPLVDLYKKIQETKRRNEAIRALAEKSKDVGGATPLSSNELISRSKEISLTDQ